MDQETALSALREFCAERLGAELAGARATRRAADWQRKTTTDRCAAGRRLWETGSPMHGTLQSLQLSGGKRPGARAPHVWVNDLVALVEGLVGGLPHRQLH